MLKKIKLFDPALTGTELTNVDKVLKSGLWASGAGIGYVDIFEKKFKEYIGTKDCIAVNSGTAALHLALSTLDIKNKEVIIPSLSFVSTAHAVLYNGGKPIFADVDPSTLCLDPKDVEKKITNKTKVILPVHFGGMPANLMKLRNLIEDTGITMVEDAAHACGSKFANKKIGNHGDLVCFSFHPVKNLAMPTGGLIAINAKNYSSLRDILTARRWCGITSRKGVFYDIKEMGWNFYMNEISAAIGLAQLNKLDSLNSKRKKVAKRYAEEINIIKKMNYDKNCSYHFYWILVNNRNLFRMKLQSIGIETGIHYTPIHQFLMYKNTKSILPVTENVGKSIVTLPTHPNLSDSDVDFIIDTINRLV